VFQTKARKGRKVQNERISRAKTKEGRFRLEANRGRRGERKEKRGDKSVIEETKVRMEGRETRLTIKDTEGHRGKTGSDDATGEIMEMGRVRNMSGGNDREPGRKTVRKDRKRESTIKKEEVFEIRSS